MSKKLATYTKPELKFYDASLLETMTASMSGNIGYMPSIPVKFKLSFGSQYNTVTDNFFNIEYFAGAFLGVIDANLEQGAFQWQIRYKFGFMILGGSRIYKAEINPIVNPITGAALYLSKKEGVNSFSVDFKAESCESLSSPRSYGSPVSGYFGALLKFALESLPNGIGLAFSLFDLAESLKNIQESGNTYHQSWVWENGTENSACFYSTDIVVPLGIDASVDVSGMIVSPYMTGFDCLATPTLSVNISVPSSATQNSNFYSYIKCRATDAKDYVLTKMDDRKLPSLNNDLLWRQRMKEFYSENKNRVPLELHFRW
jgi:hypothetical protein